MVTPARSLSILSQREAAAPACLSSYGGKPWTSRSARPFSDLSRAFRLAAQRLQGLRGLTCTHIACTVFPRASESLKRPSGGSRRPKRGGTANGHGSSRTAQQAARVHPRSGDRPLKQYFTQRDHDWK